MADFQILARWHQETLAPRLNMVQVHIIWSMSLLGIINELWVALVSSYAQLSNTHSVRQEKPDYMQVAAPSVWLSSSPDFTLSVPLTSKSDCHMFSGHI